MRKDLFDWAELIKPKKEQELPPAPLKIPDPTPVQEPVPVPLRDPVTTPVQNQPTLKNVLEEKVAKNAIKNEKPTNKKLTENQKMPLNEALPKIQQEAAQIEGKTENPDLRRKLYENLINKYGLDKREELLAKISEENKGFDWAVFAAGLGSALQGRGSQGASDLYNMKMARQAQMRQDFDTNKAMIEKDIQALDAEEERAKLEAERAELKDPNSNLSKALQGTLKTMMPNRDFSKFSAEQLMKVFPFLKTEYEIAEKREERARQEREKQLEILKMARGNPIRMEVLQKAATEKERDKALEEADHILTAQKTIESLLDLYRKTERGEISRDAFSSTAKTVLNNYKKMVPETDLSIKTIGGITKAIEDFGKTQGAYSYEDFEKAVYGIKSLAEDNAKTLNSLGINYQITIPQEKKKDESPKSTPKVGSIIKAKDGKTYRVINEKGDLEPL
jgi:hypothetical protein